MKNILIFLIVLIPFLTNCKKDSDSDPYTQIKEIAWNSLSSEEKSTVTIDWKQATVQETTYNSRQVYAVAFKTTDDELLGPIIVYVDSTDMVVIGKGLRM